jgi:hypothetical protein
MTLPATECRAGHCTACGALVWRTAVAAREDKSSGIRAGQMFILWPNPTSMYARVETPTGEAPGIAFCAKCAPPIGDPALVDLGPVLRYETARGRYAAWYADDRETFYRAWLRDALSLKAAQIKALIQQWNADRG